MEDTGHFKMSLQPAAKSQIYLESCTAFSLQNTF